MDTGPVWCDGLEHLVCSSGPCFIVTGLHQRARGRHHPYAAIDMLGDAPWCLSRSGGQLNTTDVSRFLFDSRYPDRSILSAFSSAATPDNSHMTCTGGQSHLHTSSVPRHCPQGWITRRRIRPLTRHACSPTMTTIPGHDSRGIGQGTPWRPDDFSVCGRSSFHFYLLQEGHILHPIPPTRPAPTRSPWSMVMSCTMPA